MQQKASAITAILFIGLFAVANAVVPDSQPPFVPTNTGDALFPLSENELKSDVGHFDLQLDEGDTCLAKIFCGGSLYSSFAIAICRTSTGSYYVIGRSIRAQSTVKEETRQSAAIIETALAIRFLALMQIELSQAKLGTSDQRVFLDTDTFRYWMRPDNRAPLYGKTTAALPIDSRLARFNQLSGLMLQFAFAAEEDRTQILGKIDRSITGVELANQRHPWRS